MIRQITELLRFNGRREWALWKQNPTPDSFCAGMRYSNTLDLKDTGFTPTVLPISNSFLADQRNNNSYLALQIPADEWHYPLLPFALNVAVAIATFEQIEILNSRGLCFWDRHPGNILVAMKPQLRVWQVDLEMVFDLKSERFLNENEPQTHVERSHVQQGYVDLQRGHHPINVQLRMIMTALSMNFFQKSDSEGLSTKEIDHSLKAWSKEIVDKRQSMLPYMLRNLRNLQQRL